MLVLCGPFVAHGDFLDAPVVHDDLLGVFVVHVNLLGILAAQVRSNIQVGQDGVSDGHFGNFGKADR